MEISLPTSTAGLSNIQILIIREIHYLWHNSRYYGSVFFNKESDYKEVLNTPE